MLNAKILFKTTISQVILIYSCYTVIINLKILFLNQLIDLNLLFQLLDCIPNVDPLLVDLETYIFSEGLMVMKANYETITTDPEKYVEQLLELFNRFTKLVDDAFNGDPRFMTSRDKAFKSIVNDTSIFQLDLPAGSLINQKTYEIEPRLKLQL